MKINPLTVFRKEAEGSILFHAESWEVHALDATSTFIWECLEKGMDAEGVLSALNEVTLLPDSAAQEVDEFLAALMRKGYLID